MRFFALFCLMISMAFGQNAGDLCAVALRVVDVGGRPLPYKVSSFKNAKGAEYASAFEGLRGRVPCDIQLYSFQVVRTDIDNRFTNLEGNIGAERPERWMSILASPRYDIYGNQLIVGTRRFPAGYVWKGRILPLPEERLWVRIRSAAAVRSPYIQSEVEAEVDVNGEFRVYDGFFEGPYIIYVMNKEGQLVYSAPMNILKKLPTEPLVITLPAEPPAAIVVR